MTVHRVRIAEDRSVFLPDAVFIERPVEAALMPGVARGAAELPDFVNHGVTVTVELHREPLLNVAALLTLPPEAVTGA